MGYKPAMHGRDHCPKGSDPIPCFPGNFPVFLARQTAAFTSCVDGNDTVLLWDQWDTAFDTAVFSTVLSAGKVQSVNLLEAGLYSFFCAIVWAVNGDWRTNILLAGQYDFNQQVTHAGQAGGNSGAMIFAATLLIPAPFESGPTSPPPWGTMQWQVMQNSGVTRDTDFGTIMQIAYHGETKHTPEQT